VRHFDATFEVEGLVLRPNIYVPLDRGMSVLQLCRWKFFSQRNFVADFIQLKLTFIPKKERFTFWATLWET